MVTELYSEQDAETKVIVPHLKKLGYDETDATKNISLKFQFPISIQQGRDKKTIRADIVVFINNTPVIVVDAKNPRHYLTENDKEQVISYARLTTTIAPYAALCNGYTWQVFDTIRKQQVRGLPHYRDLIGDLQRNRISPREHASIKEQATRTLFAIESARDLSRLMRRCHDVIRNLKGYDPTKAFDELSKLLFAKMYEEREIAEGRRQKNRFTTNTVREMREQNVEIIQQLWRDTVTSDRYREVFSEHDANDGIELPPEGIDKIVEILENKSLGLTDLDVKGVAFEEFLASTYRGGGLGQYFTPREIVSFMVDLVDPAIGENLADPSCGTGGFLIRSYTVVSEKIKNSELSSQEKKARLQTLARSCLIGIDWESRAARTCKMNMIIHGDGHAGVYQANALDLEELRQKVEKRRAFYPDAPKIEDGTFDIILTNPPFGARDRLPSILKYYELGRKGAQKREVLLLERCIKLLKPGGRMAVVIPEGILSNKNDKTIRDYIRRECIIKAVIRLPQDAFRMSEGAACTSILYLIKKDFNDPDLSDQGDIFFSRAEYIGISPSGKPIDQNDLLSIREHYRRFEAGEWNGIELVCQNGEAIEMARDTPGEEHGLWLEPEVNRTSLLYDRLSYVLRSPKILDRFSYTYFHPKFIQVTKLLDLMATPCVSLESICAKNYPCRGKTPSEESAEGIPIIKVRNVTGQGISLETENAPDNEDIRKECARAILRKGDILVTSTGEGTIGRVDLWPYDDIALADTHISIIRLLDEANRQYVIEFLKSELGQIQILRHISGSTGQTELLIDCITSLLIPLPLPEKQTQLVRTMETARKEASSLIERSTQLRRDSTEIIATAQNRVLKILMDSE